MFFLFSRLFLLRDNNLIMMHFQLYKFAFTYSCVTHIFIHNRGTLKGYCMQGGGFIVGFLWNLIAYGHYEWMNDAFIYELLLYGMEAFWDL